MWYHSARTTAGSTRRWFTYTAGAEGALDRAKAHGWTVVKGDWGTVFANPLAAIIRQPNPGSSANRSYSPLPVRRLYRSRLRPAA